MNRRSLHVLLVVLFVLAAVVSRQFGTSGATSFRLVYERSGQPAAGLRVTVHRGARPLAPARLSSRDGRVALDRGTSIAIEDVGRGVVLFGGQVPARGNVIQVAEPIQLRGRITGDMRAPVRVRAGVGSRVGAAERWRENTDQSAVRTLRESEPFGLKLPLSPLNWHDAQVDGREFTTQWFAATSEPQLALADADGRIAVVDVDLPAVLAAGDVVQVPEIQLEPARGIDLTLEVPTADVPFSFLAAIRDAVVEPSRAEAVARVLSALDQIDLGLFETLVIGQPLAVPLDGRAAIRHLPAFSRLVLDIGDPPANAAVVREVAIEDGIVSVNLRQQDYLATRSGARTTLSGQVVREGGGGVAGARIVYTDFPDRRETVTGADGRFTIPNVFADRPVTVFVDATSGDVSQQHEAIRTFTMVEPRALSLTLPRRNAVVQLPRPVVAPGSNCTLVTNDDQQYPAIAGEMKGEWRPFEIVGSNFKKQTFDIRVSALGEWKFTFMTSAFVGYYGFFNFTTGTDATVTVNTPLHEPAISVNIRYYAQDGSTLASGINVAYASYLPDLEPINSVTDSRGQDTIYCINTNPLPIFVRSKHGCYDGELTLTDQNMRLRLGSCGSAGARPR